MGSEISAQDRFWNAVRWADAAALRKALQDGADARQWLEPHGGALHVLGLEWVSRRATHPSSSTWYTAEDVDGCVQMLLQSGADPRRRDHHGRTALHNSFLYRAASPHSLALLIGAGLDVKTSDNTGATPAHVCAMSGRAEMAEVLKNAGADFGACGACTNGANNKPIHVAATYGNVSMIEWLLSQGYSLLLPNGQQILAVEMWIRREEGVVSLAHAVARMRAAKIAMKAADVRAIACHYGALHRHEDAKVLLDVYAEALHGLSPQQQRDLAWETADAVVSFGAAAGGLGATVRDLIQGLLEPIAPLGQDGEVVRFAIRALRQHHRHSTVQSMRQLLVDLLELGWQPSESIAREMARALEEIFEGTLSEGQAPEVMAAVYAWLQADDLLRLQDEETGVESPR